MTIVKKISEKEQNHLDEEVEIEFYNIEEPGVMHRFTYGTTRNPKTYVLVHGARYRLPRQVIQHIESKGPSIWNFKPDGRGSMGAVKQGNQPRFQCRQIFN